MQWRTRRFQRGFTLIELLACVVILGVLAAVAAPRFATSQAFLARGYADEVVGSLRYARRIAIASGCMVQVTINAAGYSGWQQTACNAGAWTQGVTRPDGTAFAGVAPAGVAAAANTNVIFQSDGAVVGGPVNLAIETHAIVVNGTTGHVSVQ